MNASPSSWHLEVARIDGALPLLSRTEAMLLARISLRRLWNHHVSAYPFENLGPDHDPGLDAAELVRSYHVADVNGQRTLHPTPHANSPDRQNSLHRRYFLTPFNIRAAALDDGASLRP